MFCATSGELDYRYYNEIIGGEGKDMAESPLVAKYGSMLMPKFAEKIIATDLMTANNQKENIITEKEAEAIAAERYTNPYLQT
jgi:hypothetical protein